MTNMIDNIENCRNTLYNRLTPDYCTLVDTTARESVTKIVLQHYESDVTKPPVKNIFDKLAVTTCTNIEAQIQTKLDTISAKICTYVQNKVDITLKQLQVDIKSQIDNQTTTKHNDAPPLSDKTAVKSSTLVPSVAPSSIRQTRM